MKRVFLYIIADVIYGRNERNCALTLIIINLLKLHYLNIDDR